MRGVLIAVSTMGLAAFAAPPEEPARTPPGFAEQPDPGAVARHYPERALRLEKEGRATIGCRIDRTGKLSDCRALEEFPEGLGFGDAAVAMSAEFRMRPGTLDGEPVEGLIRIPISFKLPPDPVARWPWEKPDSGNSGRQTPKQKPGQDLSILTRPWVLIGIGLAIFMALGVLVAALSGRERRRPPDV